MTMNKPLVSVIMPVYNGEKYIRKAVESVYEQGVSLELLVIDDGSTDHTEEVLSAYEGREDFRYIKNEQNMGAAGIRPSITVSKNVFRRFNVFVIQALEFIICIYKHTAFMWE